MEPHPICIRVVVAMLAIGRKTYALPRRQTMRHAVNRQRQNAFDYRNMLHHAPGPCAIA